MPPDDTFDTWMTPIDSFFRWKSKNESAKNDGKKSRMQPKRERNTKKGWGQLSSSTSHHQRPQTKGLNVSFLLPENIVKSIRKVAVLCFQEKVVAKAAMMERSCPKAEVKARQAAHVARDERTRSPESHAKKRGPRGNPERKKVSVCLLFSNQFTFITNMGRIIWMSADIRTAIHTARHHKSAPFLNINALWTERCMEFYISSLLSNRKKNLFSFHSISTQSLAGGNNKHNNKVRWRLCDSAQTNAKKRFSFSTKGCAFPFICIFHHMCLVVVTRP